MSKPNSKEFVIEWKREFLQIREESNRGDEA